LDDCMKSEEKLIVLMKWNMVTPLQKLREFRLS